MCVKAFIESMNLILNDCSLHIIKDKNFFYTQTVNHLFSNGEKEAMFKLNTTGVAYKRQINTLTKPITLLVNKNILYKK